MKITNVQSVETSCLGLAKLIALFDLELAPGIFLNGLTLKQFKDGTLRAYATNKGERHSRIIFSAALSRELATAAFNILNGGQMPHAELRSAA